MQQAAATVYGLVGFLYCGRVETTHDFLSEISQRGLLHQVSHADLLSQQMKPGGVRGYAGFDPTADSLTIGNFIPIKLLMHWQRAGQIPYVVMGGGTGLIGDPSGKSAERQLLSRATIEQNVMSQRLIFERLLDFSGKHAAVLKNNLDWLGSWSFVDALRDVGKHFSVNAMVQRDSVRERLLTREQGISYTEFSYMILQAFDFLHLRLAEGVTVQLGGSDQWGNIVSGCDLIRRALPEGQNDCFAVTAPLLTRSDGGKFGKTETGAVWLSPEKTSPYAFYQFWLNTDDADVERYLTLFTFLPLPDIAAVMAQQNSQPGARVAHRVLARHMTELLHGLTERERAEAAAAALFSGNVANLSEKTLLEVLASVPRSTFAKERLSQGVSLVDVLVETTLCKSKREARDFLQQGAILVSGQPAGLDDPLTPGHLLCGKFVPIRRGKKQWHLLCCE